MFWQGGAGGAAVCVCLGGAALLDLFCFVPPPHLAAVSRLLCGPTGKKAMERMTQPALCFYSHSLSALWASVVHSLPPHQLHRGFTLVAAESWSHTCVLFLCGLFNVSWQKLELQRKPSPPTAAFALCFAERGRIGGRSHCRWRW